MVPTLAGIVWTPAVFYIAMGIIHILIILIGFRVLQVDVEHNSFVGALIAGVAINVTAFFVKDLGVIGIMFQIAVVFGSLVLICSGEVIKAAMVAAVCIAAFGGVATVVIPRTPLTDLSIGGFSYILLNGGLQGEPIDENDAKKLIDGDYVEEDEE